MDWLVENGGTGILTETNEMTGTTSILAKRGCCSEVSQQITAIIDNQEKLAEKYLGPVAKANISPGNMDGGMSSLKEKVWAVSLNQVPRQLWKCFRMATAPKKKGMIIMDGPGYDTEGMSGLAGCRRSAYIIHDRPGQSSGISCYSSYQNRQHQRTISVNERRYGH
jgi:altronate dehydratase large subunit